MRRALLLVLLATLFTAAHAVAQSPAPLNLQDGYAGLNQGWRIHAGDNPAWAQPAFPDQDWPVRSLAQDAANPRPGWRWFRITVPLPPHHPPLALLIVGPDHSYEVFANGVRLPGAAILSPQRVRIAREHLFLLPQTGPSMEIALRVDFPSPATQIFGLTLDRVALGSVAAIEAQRQVAHDRRVLSFVASAAINLALLLAGMGSLLIYLQRRVMREYLWLSLYLITSAFGSFAFFAVLAGLAPVWVNAFLGDPFGGPNTVSLIEFTFAFALKTVSRPWRWYEALLLFLIPLSFLTSAGLVPGHPYLILEGILSLPAALLLPALLTIWFVRGNREAGWLIVPSLLTALGTAVNDNGLLSGLLGGFSFPGHLLIDGAAVNVADLFDILLLLAVGVVMFLRFSRVSNEQARSAAELDAAREMQRELVPSILPTIPNGVLRAAYLPAAEVGGDFYQVIVQPDGSTLVAVGDVSGKGLKAAMAGVLAIGVLRTLVEEGLGLPALLARLNRQLLDAGHGGFITLCCVRLEENGALTLANAGHLAPYRNGEEVAPENGLPLGLVPDAEYVETTLQLAPGDTLTFLSDGVLEARNSSGELFGFDRTRAISTQSAEAIAEAAQRFGQEDDITVLTLQFAPVEVMRA